LYDTMGRLVLQQTAQGAQSSQKIDLQTLPSGVYVLFLQTEEGLKMHQKVIKK